MQESNSLEDTSTGLFRLDDKYWIRIRSTQLSGKKKDSAYYVIEGYFNSLEEGQARFYELTGYYA